MSGGEPLQERRDTSPVGRWNRAQFALSLQVLRDFGFSVDVVEYCRQRAREAGRLPHEVLAEIGAASVQASNGRRSPHDRRDTSPAGAFNRAQFDASLQILHMLHLSNRALEHFRRRARGTHRLPHELLKDAVEGMVLGATRAD